MRSGHCLTMCVLSAMVSGVAVAGAQTPPATAADAPQGPIVAVHHEPHHRQVFQYGPMRILDLQLPPGDISWFHTHEWPVFYLTTSDSPTVSQNLGEEWGAGRGRAGGAARGSAAAPGGPTAAPAAGRAGAPARGGRGGRPRLMSDVSYAERTVTHRIRNDGTSLFRAMVVVNETRGGDEAVTEAAAGFEGKALSSNRWFRAYRIALEPGAKTAPHEHKAPVVVLQDTPGKGIGTGPMKFEFNEPGQWGFFDAGTRHEIANTGDGPVEFIEVEVRR